MRVDLPSGTSDRPVWVDIREDLKAADKIAVQGAISVTVDTEGLTHSRGGLENAMRNALLARLITDWSFREQGIPIPAQHAVGPDVIPEVITDLDDYDALSDAVQPMLVRVMRRPKTQTSSTSS